MVKHGKKGPDWVFKCAEPGCQMECKPVKVFGLKGKCKGIQWQCNNKHVHRHHIKVKPESA